MRARSWLAAAYLAVACGGGGKPVKVDAQNGGVSGRFEPKAAGMEVVLCAQAGEDSCQLRASLRDTTDGAGRFAMSMVPPGRYVIGFAPAGKARVSEGAAILLVLMPKKGEGAISLSADIRDGKATLSTDMEFEQHVVKAGGEIEQSFRGLQSFRRVVIEHKDTGLSMAMANGEFAKVTVEAGKVARVVVGS